ncbi:hypothetical protein G6F59_018306 [Rhizopus arrhizus]|nr:hypothetical protein G6F59_018306 [Rhizopus arrhizus]
MPVVVNLFSLQFRADASIGCRGRVSATGKGTLGQGLEDGGEGLAEAARARIGQMVLVAVQRAAMVGDQAAGSGTKQCGGIQDGEAIFGSQRLDICVHGLLPQLVLVKMLLPTLLPLLKKRKKKRMNTMI